MRGPSRKRNQGPKRFESTPRNVAAEIQEIVRYLRTNPTLSRTARDAAARAFADGMAALKQEPLVKPAKHAEDDQHLEFSPHTDSDSLPAATAGSNVELRAKLLKDGETLQPAPRRNDWDAIRDRALQILNSANAPASGRGQLTDLARMIEEELNGAVTYETIRGEISATHKDWLTKQPK